MFVFPYKGMRDVFYHGGTNVLDLSNYIIPYVIIVAVSTLMCPNFYLLYCYQVTQHVAEVCQHFMPPKQAGQGGQMLI